MLWKLARNIRLERSLVVYHVQMISSASDAHLYHIVSSKELSTDRKIEQKTIQLENLLYSCYNFLFGSGIIKSVGRKLLACCVNSSIIYCSQPVCDGTRRLDRHRKCALKAYFQHFSTAHTWRNTDSRPIQLGLRSCATSWRLVSVLHKHSRLAWLQPAHTCSTSACLTLIRTNKTICISTQSQKWIIITTPII